MREVLAVTDSAAASEVMREIVSVVPADEAEERDKDQILAFVRTHPDPFSRAHLEAHLTASALVVREGDNRLLFGFHRKLGRWLQLGGHGEPGEVSPFAVALREAVEESGIDGLDLHPATPGPVDLDIHAIPARGNVPAHLHLDIRYVLVAPARAEPVLREDEHMEMRWFTWTEAQDLGFDPALRRLLAKAHRLCAGARKLL